MNVKDLCLANEKPDYVCATATMNRKLTVRNVAPTITSFTNNGAINEGGSVTVTATASDPGGVNDPISFEFDCDDDDDFEIGPQASGMATCAFADNGSFSVHVRANDDDSGVSTKVTTVVTVNNVDPVVTATGSTINENGTATVRGTITDPGSLDTFTLVIDWGEGNPKEYNYSVGATNYSETHQYLDDNPPNTPSDDYQIDVTVTDKDGGQGEVATTVTVNNVDPVAALDSVVDHLTKKPISRLLDGTTQVPGEIDVVLVGTTIDVAGRYTDVGTLDTHTGSIVWGDGAGGLLGLIPNALPNTSNSSTDTASHTYATPGTYTFVLTITDDDVGSGSQTAKIEVVDAGDALENVLVNLQELVEGGGLSPEVETALTRALHRIDGNPDDAKSEGARDHWGNDELVASLVKILQAIDYLEDTEGADATLNLSAAKSVLVLIGKSIVEGVIKDAKALADKKGEFKKVAAAEALRDDGDAALAGSSYVAAVNAYIDAVRKIENIIN